MRAALAARAAGAARVVRMDVPAACGEGIACQVASRAGTVLSDIRMHCREPLHVSGPADGAYLQLVVCLGEGASWGTDVGMREVAVRPGQACLYHAGEGSEHLCYARGVAYRFQHARMARAHVDEVVRESFEPGEARRLERLLAAGPLVAEASPSVRRVFGEALGEGGPTGMAPGSGAPLGVACGSLFVEGAARKLLAYFLADALAGEGAPDAARRLAPDVRAALLDARSVIDADPAAAPCVGELARRVGLSPSRLSRGFASLFGQTVHAYVIRRRLEAAAALLDEGMGVGQAARRVGYAKLGNFAAAFRRAYGVTPSAYAARPRH